MQQIGDGARLTGQEQLLLSVAEQMARPMLQIARLAELSASTGSPSAVGDWQAVKSIAESSLQLMESYVLSMRVHGRITPLELEPITISSLLYDTAHTLQPFAKQYGVELELEPGPRVLPVLADRSVLGAALTSLGQVFVLAQTEADEQSTVRLSAHRSRYGVVAGLYGNAPGLGADSLRRAQALQGRARQPFQKLVSGPAAGVFVAESLLQTLAAHLHVARYHNMTGLAATFQPSQQLHMV